MTVFPWEKQARKKEMSTSEKMAVDFVLRIHPTRFSFGPEGSFSNLYRGFADALRICRYVDEMVEEIAKKILIQERIMERGPDHIYRELGGY